MRKWLFLNHPPSESNGYRKFICLHTITPPATLIHPEEPRLRAEEPVEGLAHPPDRHAGCESV